MGFNKPDVANTLSVPALAEKKITVAKMITISFFNKGFFCLSSKTFPLPLYIANSLYQIIYYLCFIETIGALGILDLTFFRLLNNTVLC